MALDRHCRCDVSPHCQSIDRLIWQHGLPVGLRWRWAHLGPIDRGPLRLAIHDARTAPQTALLPSSDAHGRYEGYHLDLLGVTSPPPRLGANYHHLAALWFVYAVAWRDADGPRVEWQAHEAGPGEFTLRLPAHPGWRTDDSVIERCKDLIWGRLGQPVQRGRPRRSEDAIADSAALGVLAEQDKARHPRRTWAQIAAARGVHERTLRRSRADARRLGLIVTADDGSTEIRRLA